MKQIRNRNEFLKWQEDYQHALQSSETDDLRGLLSNIRTQLHNRGDEALVEFARKFDGVESDFKLKVSSEELKEAYKDVSTHYVDALKRAVENIRAFHSKQLPQNWESINDGVWFGNRFTALESAGIYVPGGRAAYPSTVLMDSIPAQLAGVDQIVMVTPPSVPSQVLVAADVCGVSEIYRVGGAQAVFALADGTTSVPKVDKIVGPGNIYVTQAKQMVYGKVDIDKPAGPSEVLVVIDDEEYAKFAAAEMLAQLEHDPLANAIVVSTSLDVLEAVEREFKQQFKSLKRQDVLSQSVKFACFLYANSQEELVDYINLIASEHLSLCLDQYHSVLEKVKHAGSIFCGPYTPVTLGDYYAGTNHVLPTEGTARFASPLGVMDFMKYSSVLSYTQEKLQSVHHDLNVLTEMEGFDAHYKAVEVRLDNS